MRQKWRALGLLCLALSLLMVLLSGMIIWPNMGLVVLVAYWTFFTLLLVVAMWMAMLDVRYTRLEFKVHERELFRETFLSDEFKQALKEAREMKTREGEHNQNL
jgi:hypothetical protein